MLENIKNDFSVSLEKTLKDRITSSLFGTFILSWFIFHWRFFYTMFFVSEEKIWQSKGVLINEYLLSTYFDTRTLKFWIFLFLPFLFTWFLIWVFPRLIGIRAFMREKEDEFERQNIIIQFQRKLENESRFLEGDKLEKLKVIEEVSAKEKEIKDNDPKILWENDFKIFKKSFMYESFSSIISAVYQNNSRIDAISNVQLLAYAHTNSLLDIEPDQRRISLTEKGKYFIKRYQEEKEPPKF